MSSAKKVELRVIKLDRSETNRNGNTNKMFIPFEAGEKTAKCRSCGKLSFSQYDLPFFQATSGDSDIYYCGCQGWD
jgi:hypothetical protein